ncbi:MAG TPA: type II toxin-antitoxin system Phd/YefM family antitoxin [Thermoanaerobaculia bacterium]|jgi:prevent-host-death family protein|nr:type II toxin-antitoxin system Phd/YefM family antitoxin [Thermoanaerobaculia bacterium]
MYIHGRTATKKKSIADARNNLPQLVREAEAGEVIELTRHGERVAMIVSRDTYDRLEAGRAKTFSAAYDAFTRNYDLREDLDADPDDVFAGVRDDDPGRDVDL